MRLEINRLEGQRNDLLLRIERAEVASTHLSIASRERLMALPGMVRHRDVSPDEAQAVADTKVPIEEHLRRLGIVDAAGRAARRAIAITNRNLGMNQGHLAWQRSETPPIFRILEDPCDYPVYSCVCVWRDGRLSIEDLRFDFAIQHIFRVGDGFDLTDDLEWATFGQRVLRDGRIARIEDIADQFYDLRHVLAFDHHRQAGEAVRQEIYRGYPDAFRANVRRAWTELGVPRARYVHNAIGLSSDGIVIVQREGTVEEIAAALRSAGADDGLILDNGGSIACWVWWANDYAGGLVSPTVDYRPPGTSVIAFVLEGPTRIDLPGGSVSYSAY